MEPVSGLPDWLTAATGPVFAAVARVRHGRALHDKGRAWRGIATLIDPDFFPAGGEVPAVVRLSRGAGLPDWLPDIQGVAVRLVGAGENGQDVDLLFASTVRAASWALVPALDFSGVFSSLAPYEHRGEKFRLLAEVTPGDGRLPSVKPSSVTVSAEGSAGQRRLATVNIAGQTGESIRFRPTRTGGLLRPLGPVHALRPAAYRASEAAAPSRQ